MLNDWRGASFEITIKKGRKERAGVLTIHMEYYRVHARNPPEKQQFIRLPCYFDDCFNGF